MPAVPSAAPFTNIILPSISSSSFPLPSSRDRNALVHRDSSSPDLGMSTQPSLSSSSSQDSHSTDYQDRHRRQRPHRSRYSDPDPQSADLFIDHRLHLNNSSSSSTSFTRQSRPSTSSTDTSSSSFYFGRPSASSASSFASPPPLVLGLLDGEPSIVMSSDADGFHPSAGTSGDSAAGSDIISSSLSTIDSQNTSIGSVDMSYMMSTDIANTPRETYYSTLHVPLDTSFSSLHGMEQMLAAPTPPHHKHASASSQQQHQQTSRQQGNGNGSTHHHSSQVKLSSSSSHHQLPTIDTNLSFSAGTPSFPLSPSPSGSPNYLDHGMMSLMNGLPMTPFSSFGSPDGEPLNTPSNHTASSSGDYGWDSRNTPLLNLASVSALLENGSSVGALSSPPFPPTNQRVTRSQSSSCSAPVPLVHHKKGQAGRPRTRHSPRSSPRLMAHAEEIDGLGRSLLSLSPVGGIRSPKYLPSPEEAESQCPKRGRTDGERERAGSEELNLSNSAIFNTTNESPEEKEKSQQHQGERRGKALPVDRHASSASVQLRSRLEDPLTQSTLQQQKMNRRKRRREDGQGGDRGGGGGGDEDNIFTVAIADSAELRSLSPVNLPGEVN
jgi:trimeric autotransporter adhesin